MPAADHHTFGYFACRVSWMILGPVVLFLLAIAIVDSGSGWATALDVAFFVVAAGVLAARWYEFRMGNAETATGEPAKPSDLRNYLLVTPMAAVAVWIVANVIGNHLFNG